MHVPDEETSQYISSFREKLVELEKNLDSNRVNEFETVGRRIEKELKKKGKDFMNHALLQLICSHYLMNGGYKVFVEHPAPPLICDIKTVGDEGLNVEIETGFSIYNAMYLQRPENMDLLKESINFRRARDISKASRYSHLSKYFGFGIPSTYTLQLPKEFLRYPENRSNREIRKLYDLCKYYNEKRDVMGVSLDEIRNAKVDYVFIIDVTNSTVSRRNASDYISACSVF